MTKLQRLNSLAGGIIMLILGTLIIVHPIEGFYIVALILSVSLFMTGIRYLWQYFTMARYMVSGKSVLFLGVIVLDFAAFTFSLMDFPRIFIIGYLMTIHAFGGVVEILRSLEAKGYHNPNWKWKFLHGLIDIAMMTMCMIFIKQGNLPIQLYGLGIITSAIGKIINVFRPSAIVYIQ